MSAGDVYVVEGNGLYKIGRSRRLSHRLEEIRRAEGFPVSLVMSVCDSDAPKLEAELHKMFGFRRVRGEWFELDEGMLSDLCLTMVGGD